MHSLVAARLDFVLGIISAAEFVRLKSELPAKHCAYCLLQAEVQLTLAFDFSTILNIIPSNAEAESGVHKSSIAEVYENKCFIAFPI
ncbi:MAG: hypothetical protein AB8B49_02260 [Nitratireductor sp.]